MSFVKNICVFLFLFFNFAQGAEPNRICINPQDVLMREDGMYLILNGKAVEITSLGFENGSYIAKMPDGIVEDILGVWWCYNCRNYNSKFDVACAYCGRPRSQ